MAFRPRNTERARELRHAATPAERSLWRFLSRSQLGAKFSRQMPVGPYFADFLCRELKLVVELDGWSHEAAPGRDLRRDAWLRREGYRVLHFANPDVSGDVEAVVTAIREEIARLAHPDPSRKREGESSRLPSPLPLAGRERSRLCLPSRLRGVEDGAQRQRPGVGVEMFITTPALTQ